MPMRKQLYDKQLNQATSALAKATKVANAVGSMAAQGRQFADAATQAKNQMFASRRAQAPQGAPSSSKRATVSSAGILPAREGYSIGVSDFTITGKSSTSMRIRGQTVLGSARVSAANTANSICFVGSLNPAAFSDRLGTQAQLYDKYVYHSAKLQFVPSVGTSTNGSVAMYLDRDYMDPAEDPTVVQAIMSAENASLGPVYSKVVCSMIRDPHEKRTYFTNGAAGSNDYHETEQFKALAYYINGDTVAAGRTLGTFVLTYDLELISPVFAPTEFKNFNNFAYNTGGAVLIPLTGYTNAVPFSFSATHQFSIVEICIADLAGGSLNAGFAWGQHGGAAAVATKAGDSLFIRRTTTVAAGVTGVNYILYSNLADAQALGENYLYNTNAVNTSLFNASCSFFWRNVGVSRSGN